MNSRITPALFALLLSVIAPTVGLSQAAGSITITPTTSGGCGQAATGSLTLNGYERVVRWESAEINGTGTYFWDGIINLTGNRITYNISVPTAFRAKITSSSYSQIALVYPSNSSPATVGGTLTPESTGPTVCGYVSGTISLSGYVGSIVQWEKNSGSGWASIGNAGSTTLSYNVNAQTQYRVLVQSGVCASLYSTVSTVNAAPVPEGGFIYGQGDGIYCTDAATETLFLQDYEGTIEKWQKSTDEGQSWTDIAATTSTLNTGAFTQTTVFRAYVSSGSCGGDYSGTARLELAGDFGGVVSPSASSFCHSGSGSLTLSGHRGSILRWEEDLGIGWISIGYAGQTSIPFSLSASAQFRAVLQYGSCTDYSSVSTVTINPVVNGGNASGGATFCDIANTTIALTGYVGAISKWQSSPNGTTWSDINNTNASLPVSVSQTTYFRAYVTTPSCGAAYSSPTTVTIVPKPLAGTLSSSIEGTTCTGETTAIAVSNNTGTPFYWVSSNGGSSWNVHNGASLGTGFNLLLASPGTWIVETRPYNSTCGINDASTSSVTIQVNDLAPPVISGNSHVFAEKVYEYEIANPQSNTNYTWNITNGVIESGQNSATITARLSQGTGQLETTASRPNCTITQEANYSLSSSINYITEEIVNIPAVTTESGIASLSIGQKNVTRTYFDGLGRSLQKNVKQGSPNHLDVIQPSVYDKFGRENRKYLPFVSAKSDGLYQGVGFIADGDYANAFYDNPSDNIANDDRPFSETLFDASPLNRPVKDYGPGEAWKSADKFVSHQYLINTDGTGIGQERIIAWVINDTGLPVRQTADLTYFQSGGYYSTGQLSITSSVDEEGNEIREYTNKRGQLILKKVQAIANAPLTDSSGWALTYYVYDDLSNLVYVFQPELSKKLQADDSSNPSSTDLNNFAFQYKYDGRRRMIEKKVPGAEPVYMVYDGRNRLVLTQDGNQRATSPYLWTFTKYDAFNRPILTGIKDAPDTLTREDMQTAVNAFYEMASAAWGEAYDEGGPVHGYTNNSFPTTTSGDSIDPNDFLTVTYYDSYDFRDDWPDDYSYADQGLSETVNGTIYQEPDTELSRVVGQVTGSKIKALDGGLRGGYTWLKSVNYYDNKYRLVQSVTDNYKGGYDRVTNLYDFTGRILKSKIRHSTNDISWEGLVNMTVTGNNLNKTFLGLGWNSGGVTHEQLAAGTDGWIECVISDETQRRAFGLTATNEGESYNTIDYAFFHDATTARIYENGSLKYQLPETVKSGDIIRIERVGTQMKYYRNGQLLYTTNNASTGALIGDACIDTGSGSILIPRASFNHQADSVSRRFVYDHAGRLKEIWHQIDQTPEVRIVYNEYNELGQLIDKKLHSTATSASDAVQSVDYKYNIRGWLTGMNEQDLSGGDPGDPKDYFGFELGYNEAIGVQNTPMYNGNISAMKWSRNLALSDTIMNAYVYEYDAMNRITAATYKTATGSPGMPNWTKPSTSEYSESGYTYDLNGNIMWLARKGKNGNDLDILEYDYGTGTSRSNQLLKVSDTGSATKGFTEIEGEGDDYRYDSNGNLLWDKNKGGQEVLRNGGFSEGSTNWVVTDTGGRLTFQDDSLIVTSHATASATVKQNDILLSRALYVVIVDMERDAGSIMFNLGFGGNKSVSASGRTAFTYQAGSGNDFVVTIPSTFAGRIKSIEVKGLVVISYNYLNLPEKIVKGLQQSLGYIYDATGRKISQELYDEAGLIVKKSDYEGEFFYKNDTLQFINHEEGRVVMTGPVPEYQYNLKDHLGNVRLTFTTKPDSEEDLATLETANAANEQSQFLNYDEAIKINYDLFDHTYNGTTGASYYSTRLTGANTNAVYGLAKSLSVMPGDTIKMQVYAKYLDPDANNWTSALGDFMAAVAGGTAPPGTVVDGGVAGSIGSGSFPFPGLFNHSGETETAPKAYLNYIVFDRDFNPIIGESGFIRITTASKENGTNVPHDLLKPDQPLIIKQPGYVYLYLSNENDTPVEVFFDDFKVEHIRSPVVQMDDYYPFGLTFNSYQRENSLDQRWKFQGQEHVDDLGLNWDSFKWRNHQPDIGRFFNVDKLSEKYYYNSPYAFSENKVVAHVELEGLEAVEAAMLAAKYGALLGSMKSSSTQGAVNRLMTNSSSLTPGNIPGGDNNLPAGNKALGALNDAKTVTDAAAKNTKELTNEVSKDALAATKAVGTGLEVAGMGTPVSGIGAAINAVAGVLDEARQVTLEGKPVEEAGTDVVVNGVINATFSGLGGAAKSTVSGEGKQAVDAVIDAHSFSLSNLFQWVSDEIRGTDEKKKQ